MFWTDKIQSEVIKSPKPRESVQSTQWADVSGAGATKVNTVRSYCVRKDMFVSLKVDSPYRPLHICVKGQPLKRSLLIMCLIT